LLTAIIQARMGSTRLPGKVLKTIGDRPMLECVVNQVSHCRMIDHIILCTSTNKNDLDIVDLARSLDIQFFRGSESDVLDRYYRCAEQFALNDIVRITGDCPLIDPHIIDDTIERYESGKYDYVNNFTEEDFPDGLSIESFSRQALKRTWENSLPEDREHVTPYIIKNPQYFKIGYQPVKEYPKAHLSVDTKEDLERVRDIYSKVKNRPILIQDVLEYYGE